jgi:hypothetical protein
MPSTSSSTSVVDAAGPTGSAPQGVHHRRLLQPRWWTSLDSSTTPPRGARHRRCLQPRWWTLLDPSTAPPRGSTIDVVFKLGGGHCQTQQQRPPPQGGRHRHRLQPWWSMLPNPPATPPMGPTIDDVFNLSGGHCRIRRQCPQGGPPSMSSPTSVVDVVRPTGSAPKVARHQRHLQPHLAQTRLGALAT